MRPWTALLLAPIGLTMLSGCSREKVYEGHYNACFGEAGVFYPCGAQEAWFVVADDSVHTELHELYWESTSDPCMTTVYARLRGEVGAINGSFQDWPSRDIKITAVVEMGRWAHYGIGPCP